MDGIPDPASIDALSRLGVVSFFILMTGLWLRRIIITRGEKTDAEVAWTARLGDSQREAEQWKKMALALVRRLDRFQRVLERVTGIEVADHGREYPDE